MPSQPGKSAPGAPAESSKADTAEEGEPAGYRERRPARGGQEPPGPGDPAGGAAPAARRGDLVVVGLPHGSGPAGGAPGRRQYLLGEVTSVTRDGKVRLYRPAERFAWEADARGRPYRGEPLPGPCAAILSRDTVDAAGALATAACLPPAGPRPACGYGSVREAADAIRPHLLNSPGWEGLREAARHREAAWRDACRLREDSLRRADGLDESLRAWGAWKDATAAADSAYALRYAQAAPPAARPEGAPGDPPALPRGWPAGCPAAPATRRALARATAAGLNPVPARGPSQGHLRVSLDAGGTAGVAGGVLVSARTGRIVRTWLADGLDGPWRGSAGEQRYTGAGALREAIGGWAASAFYVNVRRGQRADLLLGPYSVPAAAEADIPAARRLERAADPFSAFGAFGVTRVAVLPGRPLPRGRLNEQAAAAARARAGPPEDAAAGPGPPRPLPTAGPPRHGARQPEPGI